jgi:23S rRNA (uridine2552-2'-O)-methyltransferase
MAYIPQDKWALRARKEGYLARSAYKLLDIDRRFKVLKKGDLVLDLGSAPGGWIQVAREKIGPEGFILGIDIEPIKTKIFQPEAGPPWAEKTPKFVFIQKDIYDKDLTSVIKKAVNARKFNVVLSDAAPKTTGQKDIDEWRAHELSLRVLDIVKLELKKGGNMIIKIFEGPDTPEIIKLSKRLFKIVHLIKPEASVKGSKESYIIAKSFK